MSSQSQYWTVSQIARGLGLTRQAADRLRRGVPPSGQVVVNGNAANAWTLAALPAPSQDKLAAEAQRLGYRNPEELLSAPATRWEPMIPLGEIAQPCIDNAVNLQRALRQVMDLKSKGSVSNPELERSALENYRREFGHTVTARYIRRLIHRTIGRDGGAKNWNRLELYLPERPARKEAPARTASKGLVEQFGELPAYIDSCGHPVSEIGVRGVWTLAFEQYGCLVRNGSTPKKAARMVREFLFAKGQFLAPSRAALLKAFQRKLAEWHISGGDPKSLRDGREDNGAHFELPEDDRDLLINRAVFQYRGDVAPAWRDLVRQGFSDAVRARYSGKAWSKSHVPTSIRESVGSEIEIFTVMHQGPRAFDQIRGHVNRSYEGIASLKCMVADDFTMPVYFYVPDGKGWFTLTRGQILIFIDFRTLCVLGWSLQPDRNYSSLTIRSLCTHVFGEHGVPSILQFERGIWESSTLLKGRDAAALEFSEVAQGLREFGIKFIHSIRARSKTVERVGGLLQDLMEAEPGYCGRDERRDAPESLRKQMAAVQGRQAGSLDNFYSYDDWNQRFANIVRQYNADPQQGRILDGLAPDAALVKFADKTDPPMQFTSAVRYLLAHDKRPVRVTMNGVSFKIGKKQFNYRGKEIAHLVGREALAWFDPENPEVLVVTNMNRENPICVARSKEPSALECTIDPDSETLSQELARVADQASFMKARYNVVKSKFPMPQRVLLGSAQGLRAAQLGEDIAQRKTAVQRKQIERTANISKGRSLARDLGKNSELIGDDPEVLQALENLKVARMAEGEPMEESL